MSPDRPVSRTGASLKDLVGVALAGGAVLPLAPSLAEAASVRLEFPIDAPPPFVWEALKDFGALHHRLVRGFVTASKPEGEGVRVVTFSNGTQARELLIDVDDERMRLVYAATSERLLAHSASARVCPEGRDRSRLVWSADFLPGELRPYIEGQMQEGAAAMRRTLEEDAGTRERVAAQVGPTAP